jgi:hypothetical protein
MATDYQYKLGMGLIRFGQAQRGRAALVEGLVLAEAHRLNAWYFKIEQALASLHGQSEPQTPDRHISDFSAAREIREVEQGLREYALESTY